ncbi:MAG: ribose-phosphate pyrophosphokinase-like domain-containing protein, partial [Candidatus Magasanikbacteria bacterium]|nr:ribose-phosphate pyrophosphokinase-like domain-containing protein [Candidatus Magasanikbacteria bacterium]
LPGDSFAETAIKAASDKVFYFDCTKDQRNGEFKIKLPHSVRRRNVYLFVSLADEPNDAIIKTQLMLGALKNGDAGRVMLVIETMAYVNSDLRQERSPIAAANIIRNFENAGADQIIFIDMHTQNWRMTGKVKKDDIRPRKIFADDIKARKLDDKELVFIACPGCETSKIESYKKVFPKAKYILELADTIFLKRMAKKKVIVIGDMITDIEKLSNLIKFLRKKKTSEIHAYITHAVGFYNLETLVEDLDTISVSDTVPLTEGMSKLSKIRIVKISKFSGRVIREIDSRESVNKAEE